VRVIQIRADGHGATTELAQTVKLLPGAEPGLPGQDTAAAPATEPYGVSELRALRAGRNRWE
jgi:hypothetical protein